MKKILLLMMCCPAMLAAQNGNGVTVNGLDVKPGTVTFNVSWSNTGMPTLWSDSVWVFVDYNNAGKMERLPLSGATLSAPSWSAATVIFGKDGNKQGVWVVGNARTESSFSATVQLLTSQPDLSGMCAYASNYPPVGEYQSSAQIKFTGTPMYEILLEETGGSDTLTDYSDGLYTLREGYTILSFTDATGAPGRLKCSPLNNPSVTSGSYCGAGTMTLSATAADAVIDWYDAATGGTPLLSGNDNYTTPPIATSTTYYAEARNVITGCVSNDRTPVLAEIKLTPSISVSGQPSQTVTVGEEIGVIRFTGINATGISRTAGNCPSGLTCSSATGNVYTISGAPTVSGTYAYTITAVSTNGCPSAQKSGAINVKNDFLTSNTYSCGGKTYSDAIVSIPSGCVVNTTGTTGAAYRLSPAGAVIMNQACLALNKGSICPTGWTMPSCNSACQSTTVGSEGVQYTPAGALNNDRQFWVVEDTRQAGTGCGNPAGWWYKVVCVKE